MKRSIEVLLFLGLSLYALPAVSQLDAFEEDDESDSAKLIVVNDKVPQDRTLHSEADVDWFRFAVRAGAIYSIELAQVANGIDPRLKVYGYDPLTTNVNTIDDGFAGEGELFSFTAVSDGVYFASVDLGAPRINTENIAYKLLAYEPTAGFAGPDLQMQHRADYLRVNRSGSTKLYLDVTNLGGQLEDNTARNILVAVNLASGMSVTGSLPQGCEIESQYIQCTIPDLPAEEMTTLEFNLASQLLGRRNVVSTVSSFDDAAHTKLQADDRASNNISETQYVIVDRVNYGINIRTDKASYAQGDGFQLFLKLGTKEADLELGPIALYLTAETAGVGPVYITDLNLSTSAEPKSFLGLDSWLPIALGDTNIFSLPALPPLPAGNYTWSLIMGKPGEDVRQESNQVSKASVTHQIKP